MSNFPRFRYMGSKFRLLPWIHDSLAGIEFDSATDAFSGSGVVSYLLISKARLDSEPRNGIHDSPGSSLRFPSA